MSHSLARSGAMKVKRAEDGDPYSANVFFEHLDRGVAQTLGVALRRTLLYLLQGSAVTSLQIDGVLHEFANIAGVKEDVIDVALNLRNVRISRSSVAPQVVKVNVQGPCNLYAGAIEEASGEEITVVNKEQLICSVFDNVQFTMRLTIETGCGYRANVDENSTSSAYMTSASAVGVIPIEASFCPVKRVTFSVGSSRLGQFTDYDKLVMFVETDGTVLPEKAVAYAAKVLREQLMLALVGFAESERGDESSSEGGLTDEKLAEYLALKIDELELSVRSQNCLRGESIVYLGDLVQYTEGQMLKMPNFGKKSLTELKALLGTYGLRFGMKISDWVRPNSLVSDVNDE